MALRIKRIYEPPSPDDGCRILVDRLWPRGLKKGDAQVDLWLREVAPSAELRRWFGHDPAKWEEFTQRYSRELAQSPEALQPLLQEVGQGKTVTLLFVARDTVHNNAAALKAYLDARP